MRDALKYLLVVAIVAIVGYLVWHQRFSKEAKVDVAFNTCIKQFSVLPDKAKSGGGVKAPTDNDPAAAMTKSLGDAMASIMDGVGGAVCGTVKDTCAQDFNGNVCQAALNRFK
jgi:hypothetical protein